MKMRDNLQAIYKELTTNEKLLRLLYYKSTNWNDSPLDEAKSNILDMPVDEKWAIINDRIKKTNKSDGLDTVKINRILFYAGNRKGTGNYLVSDQDIIFDILVHQDFDDIDLRLSWIADTLNDIISNQNLTGIGKIQNKMGGQISAPQNYIGYRLVYTFGSGN